VCFGRQQIKDFDIDIHRVREHGEELVILDIVENLVMNVYQGVQFFGL